MPQLAQIVGQAQATSVLRRAARANKLAHAYLFTGPQGVGKATCALHLAAALNCETNPNEGCDQCQPCHKLAGGLHPDFIHLEPDGAYIKIGQVRELEDRLCFAPHEGRFRLVLIDGADLLNLNAANALLKSVEEPRPRTLFVLVASAGHRVAPTLVSRCQRIRFVPLTAAEVCQVIAAHTDATVEQQQAAAALAEGSPRRALQLLEQDRMQALSASVEQLLRAADGTAATAVFDAAGAAGKDRKQLQEMLEFMRVWLRDLLLCHEGLEGARLVNVDQEPLLREQAQRLGRGAIVGRIRAVNQAQAAIRANANATLTLESLVLKMQQAAVS